MFAVVSKRVAGTWFGKRGMKHDTRDTGQVVTIQQESRRTDLGIFPLPPGCCSNVIRAFTAGKQSARLRSKGKSVLWNGKMRSVHSYRRWECPKVEQHRRKSSTEGVKLP